MKLNTLIKLFALGAGLTAGSLFANTVTLFHTPYDVDSGGGGEFKAVSSDNGTFETFCLEEHIDFTTGVSYSYTIDSAALSGGPDTHSPGVGDPISQGTAWLFNAFSNHTLVDLNGTGNYYDANRVADAALLQHAFWILEDEETLAPQASNYYVSLVQSIFGTTGAFCDYTGSDVAVMNLWTVNPEGQPIDRQSQLIHVPDGGMTAALLGLGLACLVAFRRRK